MFSLCLTLKVILSKLKIIIALKGRLKSFLDKISNFQNVNGANKIRPEDSEKFENS